MNAQIEVITVMVMLPVITLMDPSPVLAMEIFELNKVIFLFCRHR